MIQTGTKERIVRLIPDIYPENPRDLDNLGKMLCWHRRYTLGDESAKDTLVDAIRRSSKYRESWGDWYSDFYRDFDNPQVLADTAFDCEVLADALPLYLYDHSGITMNTTGFHCPWDSGQVGFIYALKTDVRDEFGVNRITKNVIQRVRECLRAEVSTYDDYLTGNIYGFEIVDETGEVTDSCYGFYGYDVEANGMLDHIPLELHAAAKTAEIDYSRR